MRGGPGAAIAIGYEPIWQRLDALLVIIPPATTTSCAGVASQARQRRRGWGAAPQAVSRMVESFYHPAAPAVL